MIVLDEQLQGRGIERQLRSWYTGSICFITNLRPDTVVKDDAVPVLVQRLQFPTFVAINESDFWRKVKLTDQFSVVCFALELHRAAEIGPLLRRAFKHRELSTKQKRRGKVVRIVRSAAYWYSVRDPDVKALAGWLVT